jgi:competence protein ComEC
MEALLLYGMLIFAANIKRWRRAIHGLIGLMGIFLAVQIHEYYAVHHMDELAVTFLDVGQGDAAVIHFPKGKVMVIDGGGTPDGSFDPGERIVAPYLWKMKNKSVDYLINSHAHPDHLQGLLFLLENFEIGKVWNNGEEVEDSPLTEKFIMLANERLQTMGRGEAAQEICGVKVEFLHPPLIREKGEILLENDASLVLRLAYGEVSFLFCGDVESWGEEEILRRSADLQSTVIKVPHHGSKTSSTPKFVESIRPEFAVFTVRGGGRGRLPHPTVLERYESNGAKVYRTDRDGAITFITDGKELRVKTFLGKDHTRIAAREQGEQAVPDK